MNTYLIILCTHARIEIRVSKLAKGLEELKFDEIMSIL